MVGLDRRVLTLMKNTVLAKFEREFPRLIRFALLNC